jgi:hypothetical protein
MSKLQSSGYILVGLKEVEALQMEELIRQGFDPEPSLQFISRNLLKEKFFAEPKDVREVGDSYILRLNRLQKMAPFVFHYSISCSGQSLTSIIQNSRTKFDRILVFQTNSIEKHNIELLKLFRVNSFLYSRMIRFREFTNFFIHFGHISKNKIQRMLYQNKAYGVTPYTFQVIPLVLDKDFKNGIDRMVPKVYA